MQGYFRKARYLGHLVAALIGVFLIGMSLANIYWRAPESGRMETYGVILGILLTVWQVFRFAKACRFDDRNFVILRSDTGTIRLHAGVIEESLCQAAKTLPELVNVRAKLLVDRSTSLPTAADVDAGLRDLRNVVSVHDALARVLAEKYQQIIPGAEPIEFHLTIRRHFSPTTAKKKGTKKKTRAPRQEESRSIRAPRYPVPR